MTSRFRRFRNILFYAAVLLATISMQIFSSILQMLPGDPVDPPPIAMGMISAKHDSKMKLPSAWTWNYSNNQLRSFHRRLSEYAPNLDVNWEEISALSNFNSKNISKLLLDLKKENTSNSLSSFISLKFPSHSPATFSQCGAQYHPQMLSHDDGVSTTSYLRQV